ncbi:MAG: FAD-dependent oxidoreductase [Bacteroidota bacterium]
MQTTTIIGAGISGLCTAIVLQEAGYPVCIYTKEKPQATTSAIAAAIWMPFIAEPREQVNQWSRRSYEVYAEQAQREPAAGVHMVDFLVLTPTDAPLSWESAVPAGTVRRAAAAELPPDYQHGYKVLVPMIETPIYLRYLLDRYARNGGRIVQQKIDSLADFVAKQGLVINCSGLGAAALCDDEEMYPVQGQIVGVAPMEGLPYIADDEGPNRLAYVLPRQDVIILGGTAVVKATSTVPQAAISEAILARCQRLVPALKEARILHSKVGLRPARSRIRLEADPTLNVIHNYGHGGSGYTVSWGCAETTATLAIERINRSI